MLTLRWLGRSHILSPQELHRNVAADILMKLDAVECQVRIAVRLVHFEVPHQFSQQTPVHSGLLNVVDDLFGWVASQLLRETDDLVDDRVRGRGILELVGLQIDFC